MDISRRAPAALLFAALSFLIPPRAALGGAFLSKAAGLVQVRSSGGDRWVAVASVPKPLAEGDAVRTAVKAQATLTFDDGSRVELASDSSFTLEESRSGSSALHLGFGALKAFVN